MIRSPTTSDPKATYAGDIRKPTSTDSPGTPRDPAAWLSITAIEIELPAGSDMASVPSEQVVDASRTRHVSVAPPTSLILTPIWIALLAPGAEVTRALRSRITIARSGDSESIVVWVTDDELIPETAPKLGVKQLLGPTQAATTLGTPLILADSTAPKSLAGLPCSASAFTAVELEPRKEAAALPWRKLAFRWGIWTALLTTRAGFPTGEERLKAVPFESESEVSDVDALLLPRSNEPPVAAYAVPESATSRATTETAMAGDGRCTVTPFSGPSGTAWPLGRRTTKPPGGPIGFNYR
jgi:hypothetical protein